MSSKTIKYENGKIYKIVSLESDDEHVYYGSTTQWLSARMAQHRSDSKNEKVQNRDILKYFNSINWNCAIVLVEHFPCKNREELFAKENEYILKNKSNPFCLNSRCATFDYENYFKYRKEYDDKRGQTQERKDYIKQYNKEYSQLKVDCPCGSMHIDKQLIRRHEKSLKHKKWEEQQQH